TSPTQPLFGGGTDNIAFLLGTPGALNNPSGIGQNAQTVVMTATFWIETILHTIVIPPIPKPLQAANKPLELRPEANGHGAPLPTFPVPPIPIPHPITIQTKQIQYSQTVLLNFNGLSWPHVSVATLVPAAPIPVTPST